MKNTYEIECKAWVNEPQEMRKKLQDRYTYKTSYTKHDTYYQFPGRKDTFRIRIQGDETIVTVKKKTRQNGIESNLETEFTVSDAGCFSRFIEEFKCPVYVKKIKHTEVFSSAGITIELSEVETLGWFIEIEKLVTLEAGEENEQVKTTARRDILKILGELEIGEDKIEERYYTELLTGIPEVPK